MVCRAIAPRKLNYKNENEASAEVEQITFLITTQILYPIELRRDVRVN